MGWPEGAYPSQCLPNVAYSSGVYHILA